MSRLSDLLNPAPSSQSSTPPSINVNAAEASHGRNPSITSPLEALAIAATDNPPITSLPQPASDTTPSARKAKGATADAPKVQQSSSTATKQESDHTTRPSKMAMGNLSEDPAGQSTDAPTTPKEPNSPKVEVVKKDDSEKPSTANLVTEVKKEPTDTNPPTPALQSPTILPTTEGKKRPTPRNPKKGTASVIKRPAAKKRKIEAPSKDGTPFSQRSGTPNSNRASKPPASKAFKRSSATPAQSSPPRSADGDDDEDDDDGELFCICRRPDDHKWMIGCDGGCDDWFHGKCVNMKEEDAELIDKYICPNCTQKGIGVTTWKPMCRLEGCREPARITGPRPSKYCSNEHGEEFMLSRVRERELKSQKLSSKKKQLPESVEAAQILQDVPAEQEDHQAYLRGGYLRASELKSLVAHSNDVSDFKRLGQSVLAPDAVHKNDDQKSGMQTNGDDEMLSTEEERSRLEEIRSKQAELKHRLDALKDKEKLLSLVRSRAQETLSALNKRPPAEGKKKETLKDICGFDSRLSWSEVEFDEWRQSSEGSKTLESGVLGPPTTEEEAAVDGEGNTIMGNTADGDVGEIGQGVCQKKRCDRHKTWYKLHQQEIGSEREICHHELQSLDLEVRGIGERAILQKLESEAESKGEAAETQNA